VVLETEMTEPTRPPPRPVLVPMARPYGEALADWEAGALPELKRRHAVARWAEFYAPRTPETDVLALALKLMTPWLDFVDVPGLAGRCARARGIAVAGRESAVIAAVLSAYVGPAEHEFYVTGSIVGTVNWLDDSHPCEFDVPASVFGELRATLRDRIVAYDRARHAPDVVVVPFDRMVELADFAGVAEQLVLCTADQAATIRGVARIAEGVYVLTPPIK
jgi:hypothetical protein